MGLNKLSSSFILLSSCILLVSSMAAAHNITAILDRNPEFSTFNELLTKTDLAIEINKRKTITVLAVSNDKIADLSGKDLDSMKSILMTHIVLDYYGILKLQKMRAGSSILTTLYQTTGVASYGQGFLNVTTSKLGGNIVFGSAVKGATHDCEYLGTVASQPYNISVLSVSHPLVVPGIDGTPIKPLAPSPKPAETADAPSTDAETTPAESPEEAEAPVADGPAADVAETPADAPVSGPAPAEGPAADSADVADKEEKTKSSSAGKQLVSFTVGFVAVLGTLIMV